MHAFHGEAQRSPKLADGERGMTHNAYPQHPVLLVDDDPLWLQGLVMILKAGGIGNVVACEDGEQAMGVLKRQPVSAVTLDLAMPAMSGRDLLPRMAAQFPQTPIIVLTGSSHVEAAVESIKQGAYDYYSKTVERERLVAGVKRAIAMYELQRERDLLRDGLLHETLRSPEAFSEFITASPAVRTIFRYIESVAPTRWPVLVTGESGVGKEIVARAIHRLSGCAGQFVAVNVAGIDETAFADTLFGHRRGAFTGANDNRRGIVDTASGGTLFLDEIGDLPGDSQVKLLRLLQEHEYFPLGADVPQRSEARIVAATNRPLRELRTGGFRADLFYRLTTHHVHIPPLRERREDVPLLLDHFMNRACRALDRPVPQLPARLLSVLDRYSFPGNVRELEGMVFDAVSRHRSGPLTFETFTARIAGVEADALGASALQPERGRVRFGEQLPTLREIAHDLIDEALRRADGNQAEAARMLGITRQALNRRLNSEAD